VNATATQRREVDVRRHYLRSAHIEHHDTASTSGYVPTARALDVLHRIGRAMDTNSAGRAWSLTGPYGAGKSSFGLFLRALLGPTGDATYETATASLLTADPDAAQVWTAGRAVLEAGEGGFVRAVATAQREPIVDTVLRALRSGAGSRWPTTLPADVDAALVEAETQRTPLTIGAALVALTAHAPVVMIIDEFGKNLEHFADDPEHADLFVLQELAERCTGSQGLPAFLITMQHLAFDDYVRGANAVQRREWGKIQGRFQDIPFLESSEQSARLVAAVFTSENASAQFRRARKTWVDQQEQTLTELGLMRLVPGRRETLTDCYPLHPLTLLTLPDMCARFGQHGRTLFSFLTGREPHSVVEFLDSTATTGNKPLPSVGLPQLFDFFVNSGGAAGGNHSSRLLEISTTIREANGLTDTELSLLKTIGVLNLTAQSGPLRASMPVLAFAAGAGTAVEQDAVRTAIEGLEGRGLLTYRGFADEYRLWQGTDLHLPSVVANANEELARMSVAGLLTDVHKMPPAIAGRHSQTVGMLRYFDTVFADAQAPQVRRPSVADAPDGLIVYYLDEPDTVEQLIISADVKPVVVVTTEHHAAIADAVRDLAAVQHALQRDDVRADHVARRELQERAADAQRRLTETVAAHLSPRSAGTRFRLAGAETDLPASPSLSPLLSAVCDTVYNHSPVIRNEMLGRRDLTSQAAKVRRELLEAMVRHEQDDWLGMEGFGPEKAMYAAILRHTRMHGQTKGGIHGFSEPTVGGLSYAWQVVVGMMRQAGAEPLDLGQVYKRLMSPPIGLKEGPIPVLLTALLLHHANDVAIYQEGTYQPAITADLLERLVKSPDRFTIRHFEADLSKTRVLDAVLSALATTTGQVYQPSRKANGRRNLPLLNVAGPLLTFTRSLPEYTLRTRNLPEAAQAVRDALLNTRAPEQLLFTDLPAACGLAPFTGPVKDRPADVDLFTERITAALKDLRGTYPALLQRCTEQLAAELRTGGDDVRALRSELQGQASPLIGSVLEPRLRSFVALISDRNLDDEAWVEAILNNIVTRPPATWRDDDLTRFGVEARGLSSAYRRVLALHYEARSAERAGFDAQRVTLTKADGTEHSTVIWVDHRDLPQLTHILDEARDAVERLLGPQGESALLALLAGSVLHQKDHISLDIAPTDGKGSSDARRHA